MAHQIGVVNFSEEGNAFEVVVGLFGEIDCFDTEQLLGLAGGGSVDKCCWASSNFFFNPIFAQEFAFVF